MSGVRLSSAVPCMNSAGAFADLAALEDQLGVAVGHRFLGWPELVVRLDQALFDRAVAGERIGQRPTGDGDPAAQPPAGRSHLGGTPRPRSAPNSPRAAKHASSTAANTCWRPPCRSITPASAPIRQTPPAIFAFAARCATSPDHGDGRTRDDCRGRARYSAGGCHRSRRCAYVGVFVHRIVRIPPPPEGWWPQRPGSFAS